MSREMSADDRARLRKLCDMATKTTVRPEAVTRAIALNGRIYISFGDRTTSILEQGHRG